MIPTTITWQDAKITRPDDEITVLVALEDGSVNVGFLSASLWLYDNGDHIIGVTHWADLPAHPQEITA